MDDEDSMAALHSFTQCADFDVDFLYLAALVRTRTCLLFELLHSCRVY